MSYCRMPPQPPTRWQAPPQALARLPRQTLLQLLPQVQVQPYSLQPISASDMICAGKYCCSCCRRSTFFDLMSRDGARLLNYDALGFIGFVNLWLGPYGIGSIALIIVQLLLTPCKEGSLASCICVLSGWMLLSGRRLLVDLH